MQAASFNPAVSGKNGAEKLKGTTKSLNQKKKEENDVVKI